MNLDTSSTPKPKLPGKNSSDELFDEFEFRPLSEGLGFHQPNKSQDMIKEVNRQLNEKATRPMPAPAPSHPFEQHRLVPSTQNNTREYVQNDLALFYEAQNQQQVSPVMDTIPEPAKVASLAIRFAAFAVDLGIVFGLLVVTMQAVSWLTGVEFISDLMKLDSLTWTTLSVIFSGYFLLYFTLLEVFQRKSLGKDLFGLSLEGTGRLTMEKVFIRSFMTLVGFLSLGLISFVDVPGKMSQTRVIVK